MTKPAETLKPRSGAWPDPPLPPALWARVAHARRRQLARQRTALGGAVAVALALAVLPLATLDPGARSGPPTVAAVGTPPVAGVDVRIQVRGLDRELQAAYRRGDGEAEIAQLWRAREDLLRGAAHPAPVRPIRI